MATVTSLHQVNGGNADQAVQCANCGAWLGNERAVASFPSGPKFFCKQEQGDKLEDSCYLAYRRKFH